MSQRVRELGYGRVMEVGGTIIVDGRTLEDEPDEDQLGYDGDEEDVDLGDDGEMEDDVLEEGAIGGKEERNDRRNRRDDRRDDRRNDRRNDRRDDRRRERHGTASTAARAVTNTMVVKEKKVWGMTAVSGTTTAKAAGAVTVQIRLQHDFKAKDITFEGSMDSAKVTSIFFGDRAVWSNSSGIPVKVFGSSSAMRGLLKGQGLYAGLDIVVNGTVVGEGDFSVTMIGAKPV